MAPFNISLPFNVVGLFSTLLPYLITLVVVIVLYKFLVRKRAYGEKIIEIKEGPLEVTNLLKDSAKRRIIRSLSKERKYVSAVAFDIKENAPRTRYHLGQLEKAGLVGSFKLAREVYFTLTNKGRWALDAINYYYPTTNFQWILSRWNKAMGMFQIKKLIERKKEDKEIAQTEESVSK